VLCVAGFVVGTKLAWSKHLYVDDLVTAAQHRSRGAGAKMISWLKAHALELGCQQLHLDSGVQRFEAHRFYLREGFNIGSHHFSITDLEQDRRTRG
jgi:GNAT superfamily N-acetyltransferase